MKIVDLSDEIKNRFGNIKRARNCFLYTAKGVRLTDLYQQGGRAILGWGGSSAFTVLKNVLSRGLTGSFSTDYSAQLKKAVSCLLASERDISVYTEKSDVPGKNANEPPLFWKPWNQDGIDWKNIPAVIIQPPFAWCEDYYILAVIPDEKNKDEKNNGEKYKSGVISAGQQKILPAPIYAGITRSIYNMIAALQSRSEKDWYIYDPEIKKYWTRKGPYLIPKVPEEKYDDFVRHCLDCELVISPDFEEPSIVPFGADRGVFGKLKKNPFNF